MGLLRTDILFFFPPFERSRGDTTLAQLTRQDYINLAATQKLKRFPPWTSFSPPSSGTSRSSGDSCGPHPRDLAELSRCNKGFQKIVGASLGTSRRLVCRFLRSIRRRYGFHLWLEYWIDHWTPDPWNPRSRENTEPPKEWDEKSPLVRLKRSGKYTLMGTHQNPRPPPRLARARDFRGAPVCPLEDPGRMWEA